MAPRAEELFIRRDKSIYYTSNPDTGANEPFTDLRIDDYDIFNITYKATHEIRRIVYGTQPSGYEGPIIRLIFKNANTTVRNGIWNIRLSGSADFHPGAGATLSLLCDGATWYEIGRAG